MIKINIVTFGVAVTAMACAELTRAEGTTDSVAGSSDTTPVADAGPAGSAATEVSTLAQLATPDTMRAPDVAKTCAADCAEDQACVDGVCVWLARTAALGEPCDVAKNVTCESSTVCADQGDPMDTRCHLPCDGVALYCADQSICLPKTKTAPAVCTLGGPSKLDQVCEQPFDCANGGLCVKDTSTAAHCWKSCNMAKPECPGMDHPMCLEASTSWILGVCCDVKITCVGGGKLGLKSISCEDPEGVKETGCASTTICNSGKCHYTSYTCGYRFPKSGNEYTVNLLSCSIAGVKQKK